MQTKKKTAVSRQQCQSCQNVRMRKKVGDTYRTFGIMLKSTNVTTMTKRTLQKEFKNRRNPSKLSVQYFLEDSNDELVAYGSQAAVLILEGPAMHWRIKVK